MKETIMIIISILIGLILSIFLIMRYIKVSNTHYDLDTIFDDFDEMVENIKFNGDKDIVIIMSNKLYNKVIKKYGDINYKYKEYDIILFKGHSYEGYIMPRQVYEEIGHENF